MKNLVLCLIYILFIMSSCSHKSNEVDLIIHNAIVYTLDSENSILDAIAIKDGKIIEVGQERGILNKYKSAHSIDLQRRPVYPGFIDAHCHLIPYGEGKLRLDLSECASEEEMITLTRRQGKKIKSGWIIGSGWDQNKWPSKEFPNKRMIDSIFPDRPVFLKRSDLHTGLANQKALDLVGFDINTEVSGGEILKSQGELTGIILDAAYNKMLEMIPEGNVDESKTALKIAQNDCFRNGLTSVSDAALKSHEVELIREMHKSGELSLRIYGMLMDNETNYSKYLEGGPIVDDRLHVGAFKFFLDGTLGSRGAALCEEYDDDPGNFGILLYEKEQLMERGKLIRDAGWQMNTHAIGDKANKLILEVYQDLLSGKNDRRWRLEHAQMIKPEDREILFENSIIPSVQPTHATSDMSWVKDRIGGKRLKYSYSYKDLLELSGVLAIGTDFPVEQISPINSFYSAVFRTPASGENDEAIEISNSISRMDALKGMTIWAAYSNFEEKKKGTIEKGKFADLTILDRDILKVDREFIPKTKVLYTIIAGEVVFTSK